jgi:hypothetical protein
VAAATKGGEVPVDFRKLTTARHLESLVSPRDIFTALPSRAPGFGYLRDVQGQVLDAWEKRRGERDLALKMNTGAGKTIVGLLILQSCLNEGFGPALYVAPTPYLALQVMLQAQNLGIPTVDDPEAVRYHAGRAVCVVNIHKLVNGRSVFGGPGGRARPLPIGSVVIDDVHAAIAITEAQSTVVLPSSHVAYDRIRAKFADDLRRQSGPTYLDIEAGDPTAVLRVPFWAWADHSSDVARVLHRHRDDEELMFTWPLVAEVLPISQAVFTAAALEIRPPVPPIGRITGFAQAKRRVYLTATLADDSVLVTDFDTSPATADRPITPLTASDLGDRMILAPQEINPSISENEIRRALRQFAKRMNVVVLVPSHRRAAEWDRVADLTAAADAIADAVARLRAGHVGLVVLVNKYDGIDLPDDACRILVVDGLPEAYGGIERREAALLGETDAMVGRQIQRVEQGMGRGVRSADDYCVVLLLGSRLSQLIAQPANASKLGPTTRAQLGLSRQIAAELDGHDLEGIQGVIQQALDRDAGWVTASRSALAGVTYTTNGVSTIAKHFRAAFNAAAAGQFPEAVREMSRAVSAADDPRIKGWLQEQQAVYVHQLDPAKAQHVLAGAIKHNLRVTRPMHGVTYRRLAASADQAQAAAAYLGSTYGDRNALLVGVNALLDDLVFDPEHTDAFEDAMETTGRLLGFAAQRPERDTGNGPDVLWAIGDHRYLVIECKSGATADRISRKDVSQLAHSINWFEATYDQASTAIPVLIHPVRDLDRKAIPSAASRIVTGAKLKALRDAIRSVAAALGDGASWSDTEAIGAQLRQHRLAAAEIIGAFTLKPLRAS